MPRDCDTYIFLSELRVLLPLIVLPFQDPAALGNKIVTVHKLPSQKYLRANKKVPGFGIFYLLDSESDTEKTFLGNSQFFFLVVACCCGLCMPNMLITKADAKENLREWAIDKQCFVGMTAHFFVW